MIREINIKVYYEVDAELDKYFDVVTPPNIVEDKVYDELVAYFAQNEGFQGMRVDCDDTLYNIEERRRKLIQFIGCEQMEDKDEL